MTLFLGQLPLALARQPVEARAPVALGPRPGRGDPAVVLEAVERRIERPFLDPKQVLPELRDPLPDRISVERPRRQRLEHQQIETAVQDIRFAHRGRAPQSSGYSTTPPDQEGPPDRRPARAPQKSGRWRPSASRR